jgi:hypothetical protein
MRISRSRTAHALTTLTLAAVATVARPALSQSAEPSDSIKTHADATPTPAAPAPTGDQAKCVVDEMTFNAGDIAKGTTIDHDFVVKNTGKVDLMITSVKPSCGCTAPDWTKLVAAGGTGRISLKVDTARFKGPIQKTATVTTNDPENANFRLTVSANITTYVDVTPSDIVTFRHFRGEEKREELTIKSNEPAPFEIKDVQITGESAPSIQHEVKKGAGANEYTLALWLDPKCPIGNLNGDVKVITNSAKEPEVHVTVRGTVLGQITVSPSSLYFRVETGSASSTWLAGSDNLNVRERGELGSPVVAKLAKGARLTSLGQVGDWLHVRTDDDKEGWVSTKLVDREPAPATANDQQKIVNVTHRLEGGTFQVTGTQVQSDKFPEGSVKVASEAVKEGQSYRLTVTYSGGLEKGSYTGTLIVKTSDKDEPEVPIPIYISVV